MNMGAQTGTFQALRAVARLNDTTNSVSAVGQ